jgi:bifunctional non-homologous end joining protein LigD
MPPGSRFCRRGRLTGLVPSPHKAGPAEDRLASYRRKRDFEKTPEPPGEVAGRPGRETGRFVVQRHRARRLHYDFRLETGGVLVSWAVPKGPSLDPSVRRAAFRVEDHPLGYIDFEGVIPAGEYGAGDVIVWDEGTWLFHEAKGARAPDEALEKGELHFELHGHKLRGGFVLVRTRVDASGKEQWLMLHKRDGYAIEGWDPEDYPRSVLSGRTNEEVKAGTTAKAPTAARSDSEAKSS